MTDQEKIKAVVELDGWVKIQSPEIYEYDWFNSKTGKGFNEPVEWKYLDSRDAILIEALLRATGKWKE